MSTVDEIMTAYENNKESAIAAFMLYVGHCGGIAPRRVPGMSTDIRLAIRIENGFSVSEAAGREYLYRWRLAIKPFDQTAGNASSIFGTPHCLGQ